MTTDERTPEVASDAERRPSAASALGWSFGGAVAARLGTVAIGVVLARLLGPEEFGTYAIAYVALLAVLSFNELGVSLAIVRWPGDPRSIAPTVTTISVAASLVTAVAVALAAGPFATAMGDASATGLVQLLALCVVINGVVATPAALLQRGFRQDRRAVIDQVNVWLGSLVSVGLALAGVGAASLVIGRLAGAFVSGVLFLVWSPQRLRFGFDRTQVRPLLAFGMPLAGASIIVFAAGYADQIVVGRLLGPVELGFYVLAFNLASWPVSLLSQPVRAVAPALFARIQEDARAMGDAFVSLVRPLAAVAFPACCALAVAAEPIVRFVYGEAWHAAAGPLRFLALVGAFRIVLELAYDYLVVRQRSTSLLVVQAVWFVALVPAVMLGAHLGGTSGAALGQLAVVAAVVLPWYLVLLARADVDRGRTVRALGVPALGSGVLALVGLLVVDRVGSALVADVLVAVLALGTAAVLVLPRRRDLGVLRATRAVAA